MRFKQKIGIFGYGSQGRAHALNLRDAGYNVIVANKKNDIYARQIKKDKFKIYNFQAVAKEADVIFILLPDYLHKKIFENFIYKYSKKSTIIIIAHGYSIYFEEIKIDKKFNWYMLAPRYPGIILRDKFIKNKKILNFHSVIYQESKKFEKIFKNVVKNINYILDKKYRISFKEETELDLFIEQYTIPKIISTIEESFEFLVKKGFNPVTTLTDIHASGEISELLYKSRKIGIHQIWKKIASPTCRYGIFRELKRYNTQSSYIKMNKVLKNIKNGNFNKSLNNEFKKNLKNLNKFDQKNNKSFFYKTLRTINKNYL